jgi:hypothetical protein
MMTVKELYEFAKKHGFEDSIIMTPTGQNSYSSVYAARLTIISGGEDEKKQVYLIYNS